MTSQQQTPLSSALPIAVDAMGGDHGPRVVVEGAVAAARNFGVSAVLVGDETQIQALLKVCDPGGELPLTVQHASQVVGMDESPGLAIRGKQDSSVRVAFELVSQGRASAVVSPGNTGAIMAAGVFVSGTLPGIARPAIASLIPKGGSGTPTVLLDAGANTGCHAFQLVQFAIMGHYYAEAALGCTAPRIALLSNGTELAKGNDIIRSAAMMLSELDGINFIGYVEGRDIARDVVDVVVCDGFVGNIVLKAMEGCVSLVTDSMKAVSQTSWRGKVGLWLARPVLRTVFKDKLDPSAYGGAPLLGLGQIAIKCHGSSSSRAVMNGIRVAQRFVEQGVLERLHVALQQLDVKNAGIDVEGGQGWSRAFEKKVSAGKSDKQESKKSVGGDHGRE
ncbi:MAG: phosphate acyltransferase PlsX [Pseudomonadota bacterium]